jgi:hypothetical protein
LLVQPLGEVARGAAARHHGETIFGQPLANGGSNAPHTTGYVRYLLYHRYLLDFVNFRETILLPIK